ncbi:hypothetical protein [Mesorhizobium sp.]|uniref:hypothetical protein n=1 Tax=Mesorhizobium sp. TaxID=1871066 RepID=UPI000FE7E456|nr:hypothetical protein [Mesorhizobium sp.]RWH31619.1 MAG: hypothetical protein EOQ76_07330 [Mesorhizobium sp.]TIR57672.1 MAG: hypothetical protein E5X22_22880 [Mesorhizobium sp.]
MRRFALTAVFVALAAPAAAATLSADQRETVESGILAVLKDPDSARFSALSAAPQPTGETIVCGTVNAKNELGGYTGPAPFYGKLYGDGQFFLTSLADGVAEASNIIARCEALGAKIIQ